MVGRHVPGVTRLAECRDQWQAHRIADSYLVPRPQLALTEVFGEDTDTQIRTRMVFGWWVVERWDRRALMWEAADESDIPF